MPALPGARYPNLAVKFLILLPHPRHLPTQKRMTGLSGQDFDLLVIGGGITGCGVARDAAMRGLKVALVERDDFASGNLRPFLTSRSRRHSISRARAAPPRVRVDTGAADAASHCATPGQTARVHVADLSRRPCRTGAAECGTPRLLPDGGRALSQHFDLIPGETLSENRLWRAPA